MVQFGGGPTRCYINTLSHCHTVAADGFYVPTMEAKYKL